MSLQLFVVPPEQLDEWDEDFEKEFSKWKCRESNINLKKNDYRQYIININSEYNLDEMYDNLEIGLEAFRKLRNLISRFPQYDLNDNLEKLYSEKENVHVKDFVKWGAKFVGSLDTVDITEDCPTEPVVQLTDSDKEVADAETDGQLTNSVNKVPDVEEVTVNDEVVDTPVNKKGKSSCSRRKEKRRKRLLKYHQKLVDTKGLPPSRLMQQNPGLSSDLVNLRRRNLLDNFAEHEEASMHPLKHLETSLVNAGLTHTVPSVPLPVGTSQAALHPSEMIGQVNQPSVGVYGTSSNQSRLPMLCSFSPPLAGGLSTGSGGGWSTGWPEARPVMELNFSMPQSSFMYCGGNSTSMNQSSLSPSSQYITGCQEGMPQPPHSPTGGSPAYCYHCLQYGAVYTINLV